MHVGEVGSNKVEKRNGIETKEKRIKTRTLKNSVFNWDIGGINPLSKRIDSYQKGKIRTKIGKSHKYIGNAGM